MDQSNQVDVPTILASIARQLDSNRDQLNNVDNSGTHGQRMADAFTAASYAAQNAGSTDAGEQLQAAAQAMREQGEGKAAAFYAQGLDAAAQQFKGQTGISQNDLGKFLSSFVGGVQENNPAQPGQGTMLDALGPATQAFTQAQQSGNTEQAVSNALGAAINGTAASSRAGAVDPGAASATNVLGGLFAAVAPQLLNALAGSLSGGQGGQGGQTGGFDIGGLLSGLMGGGSGAATQAGQPGGQFGWVTGLLGGLMGGQGQGQGGSGSPDLGSLLGGLMGGQGQSGQGGPDLGAMLGGLMGGAGGQDGQGGMDLGSMLGDALGGGQKENAQ